MFVSIRDGEMLSLLSEQNKSENPWPLKYIFHKFISYKLSVYLQQSQFRFTHIFYSHPVSKVYIWR